MMMKPERTPLSKRPRVPPKPRTIERHVEVDPVEVYCRIRPIDNAHNDVCVTAIDYKTLKLTPPITSMAFRNGSAKEQTYKFEQVFDETKTQKEVFDRIAKPLVSNLLNGKNGLLFAYGVTGSGKTYTMEGSHKNGGVLMRTLDVIFNSIKDFQSQKCIFKSDRMNGFESQSEKEAQIDRQRAEEIIHSKTPGRHRPQTRRYEDNGSRDTSRIPDTSQIAYLDEDNVYTIFVNYIEIYNNYVYDLLEDIPETNIAKTLQSKTFLKDSRNNMYVHGCTEVEVKNSVEAIEILMKGQRRRKVAHTRLNLESSRSHSIFTIRAVQAPLDAQGEEVVTDKSLVTVSQLSLVDLAGSERTSRTNATGDRIKEAGNINNSLMTLRTCIEVLRDNQMNPSGNNKIVPYRGSKITHFFKNYFDGEGKVNMIVCVNPNADDYDETLPVMKFAELASEIQIQKACSVKQDNGLPAGRRRANLMMKEVRKKLQEEGENIKNLEMDINVVYSLGPPWPSMKFTDENYLETTEKLKAYLRQRIKNRQNLKIELDNKVSKVSQSAEERNKKLVLLEHENHSLKALYNDSIKRIRTLESQLVSAEAANESMQRKFHDYKTLSDKYHNAIDERDMAKSQGQIEKQKMKTRLKAKLESEKERLAHDMNSELKEQKHHLKSQIYANQVKALQEMLHTDSSFTPEITSTLKRNSGNDKQDQRSTTRGRQMTTNGPTLRHRRSRSQGATVTWVDHCPDQILAQPTTILQPNMPRRRSVSRLKSDDLMSDRPIGYCLTTHDLASDGEIETKVLKGDVLQTVGGGAQVVFQDVETHRQRDALAGTKRGSDGTPRVERTTLHDRCAVGIGTPRPAMYKRPRL